MHNIKFIRENKETFDKEMKKRGLNTHAEEILFIDSLIRKNTALLQDLQHKKRDIAKKISSLDHKDPNFKKFQEEGHNVKHNIHTLEQQNKDSKKSLEHYLYTLPNILDESVPIGKDEDDNVVIREVGGKPNFNFTTKAHYELGENLGMMDFKNAAKISGSRFVVLNKDLAKLERALANFMLDIHINEHGFEEISPPILVSEESMFKSGQLPKFSQESFQTSTGHRLIPTAEVSIVNMFADEILNQSSFPHRLTAHTPCFRSEAGSAGKDTKGIIRQHQFFKVEMVSVVLPENSQEELERLTNAAEEILKRLSLPYRVSLLCSLDTGFCSSKTYDIEVWIPSENQYREISSCSNFSDFQARRMNCRYKSLVDNKNYFPHTLNGSGLAVGRTIVAIMENYQNADGSITIPETLRPYMNNQKTINLD